SRSDLACASFCLACSSPAMARARCQSAAPARAVPPRETNGEASGQDIPACGRSVSALLDERPRHLCWHWSILGARCDPVLGLLQDWRAQQQPSRPPGCVPAPCLLAELRVLPDPVYISVKRIHEAVSARIVLRLIIEENKI